MLRPALVLATVAAARASALVRYGQTPADLLDGPRILSEIPVCTDNSICYGFVSHTTQTLPLAHTPAPRARLQGQVCAQNACHLILFTHTHDSPPSPKLTIPPCHGACVPSVPPRR